MDEEDADLSDQEVPLSANNHTGQSPFDVNSFLKRTLRNYAQQPPSSPDTSPDRASADQAKDQRTNRHADRLSRVSCQNYVYPYNCEMKKVTPKKLG